ncbi:MAG: YoaK family protein [Candidatus Acidiferrales bacterium]
MSAESFLKEYFPKVIVALLLTFSAGLVDIVGFVGVFQLFTAHLTGATVQLGHGLVNHNWVNVSAAAIIVGAFFCGSILGRTLIEVGSRKRIRRIASVTLAIEAVMLAALAQARPGFSIRPFWSLAALAAAMGVQTATLTGIGPLTVHTTFVTGMLNKLAQLVSHILFRGYDLLHSKARSGEAHRDHKRDIQQALFLSAVWLFYVAGAAMGTWSFSSWGMRALFIAAGLLAISVATDQFFPLSMKEEKEQSER